MVKYPTYFRDEEPIEKLSLEFWFAGLRAAEFGLERLMA